MPQFGFFNLASFQHGSFCQKKKTLIKNVLIYIITSANRSKYCGSFADYIL